MPERGWQMIILNEIIFLRDNIFKQLHYLWKELNEGGLRRINQLK